MKATHYSNGQITLCGLVGAAYTTQDATRVDCWRCRNSNQFQELRKYGPARIAWELEQTASGSAYYGNALRVAKDFSVVTPEERVILDVWATCRNAIDPANTLESKFGLLGIANKIRALQGGKDGSP